MLKELTRIRNERSKAYGKPSKQMALYARLVNEKFGTNFNASDMCVIEILHKVSRIGEKYKQDHFIDIAGYSSCAIEINEEK